MSYSCTLLIPAGIPPLRSTNVPSGTTGMAFWRRTIAIDRLRIAIGWIAVSAWIVSFILDAILPRYVVPPTVHGLMLIVAGALFGPTIMGRRRNGDGPE